MIVCNEIHLRRLVAEYIRYYHEDRTHDGLGKDTPSGRSVQRRTSENMELISLPRMGGLHHRYRWKVAA